MISTHFIEMPLARRLRRRDQPAATDGGGKLD